MSTEPGSPEKIFEKEIDIKKLFNIIKKRFWIVLFFTLISTSIGGIYTYKFTKPLYQSSARYILQGATSDQVNTLNVLVKDPYILDKVINQLSLDTTPELLSGQIALETNSQVVTVIVTDSSSTRTSDIANTLLYTFKQEIPNFIPGYNGMTILPDVKAQNNVIINHGHLKTILISCIVGLVLGIGMVFFVNSLDDTFKLENEIENVLNLPVIGGVSKVGKIKTVKKSKSKQSVEVRGDSYDSK